MDKTTLLTRREFIRLLTIAASAYPLISLASIRQQRSYNDSIQEPWKTIAAVQEHLFPAEENSPGASDINALAYLKNMMGTQAFDKEQSVLIHNGVGWLNELTKQHHSKMFFELDTDSKEKVLRRIESSSAGSRWISTLLTYLIEALLSDPVYGGNPNGIGWDWLNHKPGFPLPTEDKKYYKLSNKKVRNIKA